MPPVLEASWIGRRVVVRRVVDRRVDGAFVFGDVVGDLLAIDSTTASIETGKDQEKMVKTVELSHIALAKIVEASAADVLALQRITSLGMRSVESAQVGGWLLRSDPAGSWRANSVRPLASPSMPIDEALASVRQWYGKRGKPARFLNPADARRLLDAELGERGWDHPLEVSVLATRIDTLRAEVLGPDVLGGTLPEGFEVRLTSEPEASWCANYRNGKPTQATIDLLGRHDCVQFAQVLFDDRTVAIARGVVDEGWLGLSAISVLEEYRRRGLATAMLATLLRCGQRQGATRSYLEVSSDNDTAVAFYNKLGFWNHHDYRYRVEPSASDVFQGPAWPAPAT